MAVHTRKLSQSSLGTLQWKMIFLYLELGICPRDLSLLTASRMCLGCSGGSSPHFSHTSRAKRTKHRELT